MKENKISKESLSIIPAPNLGVARVDLPQKLYATNIELLARNPYGFFAKKILGLGRKKNISSSVEASDFGSIIHEHIEHISLHQDKTYEEIFEAICETRGLAAFYRELWKAPSIKIGKEISSSNNKVKQQTGTYFTEIEGGIYCEISGNISIELRAIADRIEVFEDKIRIIDYKTGSPPSKADVDSGKSPQLMIEAIIYFYNGFAPGIIFNESKSIELVFSKVSTKNPYLQEKIIPISFNDIEKHYTHMKSLLEFYYTEESSYFGNENIPDSWAPKYDDYAYLGRRIT
ncbi:MAG: hypothetical protein EB127_24575 [Alphaproteobacteria bacterium]|nr:hypothetical protein [Alphaproteobacteria bacterium]